VRLYQYRRSARFFTKSTASLFYAISSAFRYRWSRLRRGLKRLFEEILLCSCCKAFANYLSGDLVCIILGVDNPMLLRPAEDGYSLVVGSCFVHGLMNAEGVLGPMPKEWRFILTRDHGYPEKSCAFINNETGEQTREDPRLPPLPIPWKKIANGYRNNETGEVIHRDPRTSPEALIERCPSLKTLRLI
jgi:hypothetical protein